MNLGCFIVMLLFVGGAFISIIVAIDEIQKNRRILTEIKERLDKEIKQES